MMPGCFSLGRSRSKKNHPKHQKRKAAVMDKKSQELRVGVFTFVALAVLTGVEYMVAITGLPTIILWVIALVKAGLVMWYFMHVARVFRSQGGH
jgi:cytochrome c oxidase subunit IV